MTDRADRVFDRVLGIADRERILDAVPDRLAEGLAQALNDREAGADENAGFKEPGIFDGIAAQLYAMRAQLDAVLVQLAAMERVHASRAVDPVAVARHVKSEMERDAARRASPSTFMQRGKNSNITDRPSDE